MSEQQANLTPDVAATSTVVADTKPEVVKPAAPVEQKVTAPNNAGELSTLQTQVAELLKSNETLLAHKNEILSEKKAEQEKARVAEDAKLREAGDFKQLLEAQEKRTKEVEKEFGNFKDQIGSQQLYNEALKAASTIADGSNVEIMADIIVKRLKYVSGDVKVLDDGGNLTINSLTDLTNEYQGSEKYKSLVRGTKATGGGASGSGSSAPASNEMTRADFAKLDPAGQMKFMLNRENKLTDD